MWNAENSNEEGRNNDLDTERMCPVNGLEDWMLLKCQCSPHGFLDSIPFLSNSQEDHLKTDKHPETYVK